ncbi:MAG: NADPH-dependent assimilatory sulfite reductase hemoprotein subunit [Candidatus Hydrogenedentes bacterium]|nr:NADPH-dependent assimilatory sulfite reductase hemoprotein subunit [Candidatus Hydrogenedentota bacterium]
MANWIESNGDLEQLSGVETFKARSGGLYGPLGEDLAAETDHFSDESVQIMKHHGSYQQDDRDTRNARKKQGLDKDYKMMLRTKFPGGQLTAEQYLLCDELSTKYGQDDIRATSRQDFQFHGVVKNSLRPLIADLNKLASITTLGGCGDVVRNTMANPVADIDPAYKDCGTDLITLAKRISDATLPTTRSYYDLWLNDEKATVHANGTVSFGDDLRVDVEDPLYKTRYLPRKFKVGLAADFDNSSDIYTQDVGIMAVTEQGKIVGYEILAGGGLGFSHTKSDTYARAASHVAFVQEEDVIPIVLAVVAAQRDYGDRTDRKQARLKYTIDRMGVAGFMEKVYEYAGKRFDTPRNVKPTDQPDYLGWHQQIQDGLHYVGVWVENGRIKDFPGSYQFKSGLRAIIKQFRPNVRVTPHHNIILANITEESIRPIQAMLDEYKIPTDKGISTLRRLEMACPALPLCGLAQSESERYLPHLIHGLEQAGHGDAGIIIRMTGCPNGCARSSSSEIGLVGKGPGRYVLQTGGDYNGTRMNETLMPTVKDTELVDILSRLISAWKEQRNEGEKFGDWSFRMGVAQLRELLQLAPAK